MPLDELSRKLKEIQDKMSEALHYSIDSISSLREEERERLFEVRTRKEDLIRELNEVIVAADKAESEYRRSREELLVASRSGNEKREKDAYERAMHLMKIRGAFEEREKLLARQRDDLAREERRIEKLLVRSEEMGNRFRVALNLLSMNLEGESPASSDENGLLAGMLLAERESVSLSRDLHDGPIQKFSSIGLMIDLSKEYLDRGDFVRAGEELGRTRAHLADALLEARSFLFQLNPSGLKEGLHTPLSRLASQVRSFSGCDVRFSIEGRADVLSLQVRTAVFKIVQQAVMNAVRGGKAKNVKIMAGIGGDALRVKVLDDGIGFDVAKERELAEERGTWGLVNMEERARLIGGSLSIASDQGRGTTVLLEVPLTKKV
ncbi:MAG: sensor histidine kinase [Synergistaceae bacterium]|nr:sensor histidine kinase [Synergistaceae bacterium]